MFRGTTNGNSIQTKLFRGVASFTALTMTWLSGPAAAFARPAPTPKPISVLKPGLTQTPDAALLAKIAARQTAKANKPKPDARPLSEDEMKAVTGRGPYRNAYFSGTMPWHRELRGANLCTGNLFQSFTDIQIAPGRGAGLVLQRTYNSNDEREGPFGTGWTHAYDIRIEESPTAEVDANGNQIVPRTDFFGGKHKYSRDADGLYSPPAYMFDEMDSKYDTFLVNGPPEVLEDTEKGIDGTVKHFVSGGTDTDGSPSRVRVCDYIRDRHGNQTNLTYGLTTTFPDGHTEKKLTKVADPTGRELNFTWSNVGTVMAPRYRITEVVGPTGTYRVTYDYNADKNLSAVHLDADGLNRTTTFGYTSYTGTSGTETGLLASITDPLGHTISYQYGYPSLNPTQTVWVTGITEPSFPLSGGGTSAQQWTITTSYPFYSNLFTSFANSNAGYFVGYEVDYKLRAVLTYVKATLAGYIDIEAKDRLYEYTYDTSNNVTRRVARYHYLGGSWTSPSHFTTSTATYGPHGNVLTSTNAGSTTTFTYYNASKYFQKASITDPLSKVTTFDYFDSQDASVGNRGEVKWVRDARYATTGKQYEYAYNTYGQKIWEKNLNGKVTTFEYNDTWSNLTKVIQDPDATGYTGLKRTTTMGYDITGRMTSSTDPNGKTSTSNYNKLGQPTSAIFLTSLQGVAGETVSYTYGANGRTESVTDGRGTTTIAYQTGCDRVASVTDPVTGTLSYTYGISGERTSMTFPGGGTVTYGYGSGYGSGGYSDYGPVMPKDDPNTIFPGVTQITDDQGRRCHVLMVDSGMIRKYRVNETFNGSGSLVSYQEVTNELETDGLGNATGALKETRTEFRGLDGSGNPVTTLLYKNVYTNNASRQRTANQITDHLSNTRTETYGYDDLYRLNSVNYGDGQTQGYSFDDMGNRLTRTDSVAGNDTLTYNAANMLLTRNSGSYTNDANGNTLTGGGRTNTWDSQNRLRQAVFNSKTSAITYGSDGLRRKMLVTLASGDQTETSYVVDGQNVVQESVRQKPSGGSWTSPSLVTYLMGPSGPLYRRPTNAADVRWYLYDGLGSAVGEVAPNGSVTASKKHDVYGLNRGGSGTPTSKHGWVGATGHTSDDETGLVYMRARHYDPVIGRFVSEDPANYGANWFAYCANNPTNLTDATGCLPTDWALEIADLITRLTGSVYQSTFKEIGVEAATHLIDQIIDDLKEELRSERRLAIACFKAGYEIGMWDEHGKAMCFEEGDRHLARVIECAVGIRTLEAFREMIQDCL